MDTNILLESGTNELEVLEFTLGDNYYGINVAKIREILTYQQVTPVPNAHPCVEGIFMPRDTMMTVIDLKKCLGMEPSEKKGLFIITNFNKLNIAFHVDEVIGIHRVSWEDIIKPDSTINTEDKSAATGVIKLEGKLVVILDFEKIVTDISPETGLKVSDVEERTARDRSDSPILIAEDSPLLGKMISECLKKSGYTNLIMTMNGQEAWDKLTEFKKKGTVRQEDIIKPDSTINTEDKSAATGVIKLEGKLVVILDFEKIVTDISPETGLKVSDVEERTARDRSDSPILIAEDSPLLGKMISECLKKSGYTNLIMTMNGQEAWDKLTEFKKKGTVRQDVHCIITDIEMPLMDGHRLTKLCKSDDEIKKIPLIIFSSLVNEEMRKKGEQLGADAQLTKPEIGMLVEAIDNLIDKSVD